jgi:hypothetical protein
MTVAEILRQSGFSDAEISALDARYVTAFTGVLTTAEQAQADAVAKAAKAEQDYQAAKAAKEAAELQDRSNKEFWDNTVNPNLTEWDAKMKAADIARANAEAVAAFYKTQNEAARTSGFVPTDAPSFTTPAAPAIPPRAPNGQYIPNAPGSTPGSPTFTMEQIDQRLGNGLSNVGWAMQEYQRLTGGQFLPDPFDKLAQEADLQKLPFRDYVARKYDFVGKQQGILLRQQQEHDAKVAADAAAAKESEWKLKLEEREKEFQSKEKIWAERNANNPDQRVVVSSRIPELQRKVETKDLPDPLMMNENQRRANTAKMIRDTIAEKDHAAA